MGQKDAPPSSAVFTRLDQALTWARTHSISYLVMDLSCCGVEMQQVAGGRFDIERFGSVPQVSPKQSDLMIVAGNVSYKMAPILRAMYEEMPFPKYVIAMGSCASSGGPFSAEFSYSTVCGVDRILPVDVHVPGCPPRPEALLHGLIELQKKISGKPTEVSR